MCRNRRYLSKDAPRLPMIGCHHPESCACSFRHYEDRRTGPRRSDELGTDGKSEGPKGDRRKKRGRRAKDLR
jgi:hypothetical protein